jgi:hypothetical protein
VDGRDKPGHDDLLLKGAIGKGAITARLLRGSEPASRSIQRFLPVWAITPKSIRSGCGSK